MTSHAGRSPVDAGETVAANRAWWDANADEYYVDHGDFLGDSDLVWGPEGWTEAELGLLGLRPGDVVVEIGSGAAQGSRWVAAQDDLRVVATDLSFGMLHRGAQIDAARGRPLPLVQSDARALPLATGCADIVFTAYGAIPFIADTPRLFAEVARVLRPGGRFVFSTSHPVRWAFPDDPGEGGLTATMSYFDRTPYVEREAGVVTYAEHHRTLGDFVSQLAAAGFWLRDLVEPSWPERNTEIWGGWSPTRGAILPGTAIFVCERAPENGAARAG